MLFLLDKILFALILIFIKKAFLILDKVGIEILGKCGC